MNECIAIIVLLFVNLLLNRHCVESLVTSRECGAKCFGYNIVTVSMALLSSS